MANGKFPHQHPEFRTLIEALAVELGTYEIVVEKDYWVMHSIYGLQRAGYRFPMKGGTTLTKGYGLIDRFSEDVDVHSEPPFRAEASDTWTLPRSISLSGAQEMAQRAAPIRRARVAQPPPRLRSRHPHQLRLVSGPPIVERVATPARPPVNPSPRRPTHRRTRRPGAGIDHLHQLRLVAGPPIGEPVAPAVAPPRRMRLPPETPPGDSFAVMERNLMNSPHGR